MAAGKFIKENFVLLTGIAVPVLIVAVFLASAMTAKKIVNPPAYDLLISVNSYKHDDGGDFNTYLEVEGERLHIRLGRKKMEGMGVYTPRLFRYAAATRTLHEIHYALPQTDADHFKTTLPETAQLRLHKEPVAPDGYAFRNGRYRSNPGFPFFYGGTSHTGPQIYKNGAVYNLIPAEEAGAPAVHDLYSARLVGWVIAEGNAP